MAKRNTLGSVKDGEVRRISHIIAGEAFGLTQSDVIGLGVIGSPYEYAKTKREHEALIGPIVTLIRNLQQQKTMQLRRIMNSELQKELELRNGKVLQVVDKRLFVEEGLACEACGMLPSVIEDKQWIAAMELMKRNAPVKTVQKIEGGTESVVYHIPVGPAQRMAQIAAKRAELPAHEAEEAELVEEAG